MPASTLPRRRLWAFAPPAVTTAVVVSLSLGNALQLRPELFDFSGADKLHHLLAYGCLGVLWSAAIWYVGHVPDPGARPRAGWPVWGALFALGATMEVFQWRFYPGRYFELADMLANGIGAALGVFGFGLLLRTFPPKT